MREKKLIQLYITNMCNSHCKTCGIWKNKEREELSISDIEMLVALYPDADYVIGGGEAILHSRIEDILTIFMREGTNYTLLTNCILLDKLQDIVERFDVPAVTVSCDGINHDKIRGVEGNLDNIRRFKFFCDCLGIKFKISYTYSKYNEKTFQMDMDMFKYVLGQDKIYFCLAQDMDLLKTDSVKGEGFEASDLDQILKCDMIEAKDKAHIKRMISGVRKCCTSQNNVHTIYSNGDIVRCQSFNSNDILGNIKNMSSEEIKNVLNSVDNVICTNDAECNLLCQRRYD